MRPTNLLQHVFHRQHAHDGAEFVHHHGHVRAALAELLQHLRQRLGLRHHQVAAQQPADAKSAAGAAAADGLAALLPNRQQVFVMQNADDLFRRAFVNRQARMLLSDHGVRALRRGWLRKSIETMSLRGTMISRTATSTQIEHAVDHVFLRFGQISQAAAGADDQLQFLRRMAAAVGRRAQPQGSGDGARRTFDDHHERDGNTR